MIASYDPASFADSRWKPVRLGLRLANSCLGVSAIGIFFLLWGLIGLVLCVAVIPVAVLGKSEAFRDALEPIALYLFALPLFVMAAATWAVKLFSRLLWCAIPEPLLAKMLALASLAGRLSLLSAVVYLWFWGRPIAQGLFLPEILALSGLAWLGLAAEWGFIRTLRRDFVSSADAPVLSDFSKRLEAAREQRFSEQTKKSILTRHIDAGEWLKKRFPRAHKLGWILLPIAYVTASSLADNGDMRAVADAILRLVVVAPALLQVFWIPGEALGRLIDAVSPQGQATRV